MNDEVSEASRECNDDAWDYEYRKACEEPRCWLCGGSGYAPDIFGDAEPCDACQDYTDAIADALVPEPGMPF